MRAPTMLTDDRGETLLELVIAIVILGVCVVGIGSAVVGSVLTSRVHREQADAQRILQNYVATLESSPYVPCATATAYSLPTQTGFSAPSLSIEYWNESLSPAGFQSTCPGGTDQGAQRVKVTVNSTDGALVRQSLSVVLPSTS